MRPPQSGSAGQLPRERESTFKERSCASGVSVLSATRHRQRGRNAWGKRDHLLRSRSEGGATVRWRKWVARLH